MIQKSFGLLGIVRQKINDHTGKSLARQKRCRVKVDNLEIGAVKEPVCSPNKRMDSGHKMRNVSHICGSTEMAGIDDLDTGERFLGIFHQKFIKCGVADKGR